MAGNLTEQNNYDASVPQISAQEDITDPLLNAAPQALANRTKYLKTDLDNHKTAAAPHSGHVSHSLATAVNDFLVASAAGQFVKKTVSEIKTILGLGNAAYANMGTLSTQVATGNHGHANDSNIGGPYASQSHNHNSVYEPANANIQNHIGTVGNPHSTTAAQVGTLPAATIYNGPLTISPGLWTSPPLGNKAVAVNIVPITQGVIAVSAPAASNAISWEVISDSTGSVIRVFNTTSSAATVQISIVTIG